jgi:hypothetical protein
MKEKIHWKALEYEYKEKSADWYWALGIVALSTAIISVVYKNYLFAFFILLSAYLLGIYSGKKPPLVEIDIDSKGVRMSREFFPYSMIKSFWVESITDDKKLILHTKRVIMPVIALPIENGLEEEVRALLAKHSKEEEMREPVSQIVMEYLGF